MDDFDGGIVMISEEEKFLIFNMLREKNDVFKDRQKAGQSDSAKGSERESDIINTFFNKNNNKNTGK